MLSRLPVGSRIEACSNRRESTSNVEEPHFFTTVDTEDHGGDFCSGPTVASVVKVLFYAMAGPDGFRAASPSILSLPLFHLFERSAGAGEVFCEYVYVV